MNGTQMTDTHFLNGASHAEESAPRRAAGFMNPGEVVSDRWLTLAEKRQILASWACDARGVPDAPALRQLDNGAVVRVDDVLHALRQLDDEQEARLAASGPFRPSKRLRVRFPMARRPGLRRHWPDDDDDPPPCPAMIARPFRGPRSGGAAADPGLAMAA